MTASPRSVASASSMVSASRSFDREDRSRSRSRVGSPYSSRPDEPVGIGLSALIVTTGDETTVYKYVSDSITEILGYQPQDLIGRSAYEIFHPDEIPYLRDIHYYSLQEERCACVAYMRLMHRDGYFVECCVSYSTVFRETVAVYTRAENGPTTIQQALTARDVWEVSPGSQGGKWGVKRWTKSSSTSRPKLTSSSSFSPPAEPLSPNSRWKLPPPHPRSFFIINRFTDTCRVIFASNEIISNTSKLRNQPFYSIIKPSDRTLVKQYIDTAKSWTPVIQNERRSGGYGYCRFSVLKIPDLPAHGETYPQGTDEQERMMPGQEFIPVEGIFSASSDGLLCIISRIMPDGSSGI
ncbi:hypothetical protein DB88DRAFT_194686 [Papiliotrema laurentii]|uniref:PAS domain-containing protein n=1 Tax=Papiliotrema laurentii TaxID=5418 RepID=A0AAD9L6K0_PAPLA|nr:hypothetical protein DB88DRAFT_194686 [Papiliotrema laurentii]